MKLMAFSSFIYKEIIIEAVFFLAMFLIFPFTPYIYNKMAGFDQNLFLLNIAKDYIILNLL